MSEDKISLRNRNSNQNKLGHKTQNHSGHWNRGHASRPNSRQSSRQNSQNDNLTVDYVSDSQDDEIQHNASNSTSASKTEQGQQYII